MSSRRTFKLAVPVIILLSIHYTASSASKSIVRLSSLDNEIITAMSSDQYGRVLIGTTKGLFLYDGTRLFKYNREYVSPNPIQSFITGIEVSGEGSLKAFTTDGVYIYDSETDGFEEVPSGIDLSAIAGTMPDGGYLAMNYYTHEIFEADSSLLSRNGGVTLDFINGLSTARLLSNGNILVHGINMYAFLSPAFEILSTGSVQHTINDVSETLDRVVMSTNEGILTFSYDGIKVSNNAKLDEYTSGRSIRFLQGDGKGSIFYGVASLGIYRYDIENEKTTLITETVGGEKADFSYKFKMLDNAGQIWISETGGKRYGVDVVPTSSSYPEWDVLVDANNFPWLGDIQAIASDSEGDVYVLTDKCIARKNKGDFSTVSMVFPVPGKDCHDIVFDNSGHMFVVSLNAVFIYEMINKEYRLIARQDHRGFYLSQHVVSSDYVTFAYPGKLISYDSHLNTFIQEIPQTMSAPFVYPYLDGQKVGVQLENSHSAIYDPFVGIGEFETAQDGGTICRLLSSSGRIYSGTNRNGVVVSAPDGQDERIGLLNGLPDNKVFNLEEDSRGRIWITTANGIARYDPLEGRVDNYGEADGMLYDLSYNHMMKNNEEDILVFSSRWLLKMSSNGTGAGSTPVTPLISEVLVNNETFYGMPSKITLDHTRNNLSFYFSSVDFSHQGLISYEYKLEGYDNLASRVSLNDARYNNLPPGHYVFSVKAVFPDGSSSGTASLPIVIRPAFYQTLAFKLSALLLALLVAFVLVRFYIRTRIHLAEYRMNLDKQNMKVDLYTNLSHMIRTPVALISAPFEELTHAREWNERETGLIEVINKNTRKIMDLTEQFLSNWSGTEDIIESPEDHLNLEEKDITFIIRETGMVFRPTASNKGIDLILETPESLIVRIDEDKITKILYNLVSNALKHTPSGGKVKVSALKDGDKLTISVSDSGKGVPDADKERIFNRFYKSPDIKETPGFGIGLYHTRKLVNLHEGSIIVSDNKPTGAVFTITLPIKENDVAKPVIPEMAGDRKEDGILDALMEEDGGTTALSRILVVEDNEDMLGYLSGRLSDNYMVLKAKDGIEATTVLENNNVDLVVTDVMMPRMDGLSLCRWIKDNPNYCHIPVLVLTAKSSKTDELDGLGCGADIYVRKPFDISILEANIRNLLDNRIKIQRATLLRFQIGQGEKEEGQIEDGIAPETVLNKKDRRLMEQLNVLLEEHLTDTGYGVNDLCTELGFSRSNFYRKIRALTGVTPNKLVTNFRFSKVKELLATGDYNLSEIAYMTGFSSIATFSRRFHSVFGQSPSDYLKSLNSGGGKNAN